jgi:glutathione S-transferase
MLANFETPSRAKMLKVWGRRSSFNVQKVMWLIGELGLEHQGISMPVAGSAGSIHQLSWR